MECSQPDVSHQLSLELQKEVAELAAMLSAERVSVRDVAKDEVIPDKPQLGDAPLDG